MSARRRWLGLAAVSVLAGALGGGVVGYASADQATTVRVGVAGGPGTQSGPRTFDARVDGPTVAPVPRRSSNGETFLYRRRASDGTELRIWRYDADADAALWPGVGTASCRSTLFLTVDASSNDSIAQQYFEFADPHSRTPSFIAWGAKNDFTLLAVPAADGTRVTVTFPNGTSDTAVARDHVAVLATATPSIAAPSIDDGSLPQVQATDPNGRHLDLEAPTTAANPLPGLRCPPELPPTGKQPADPADARGQITDLITRLLSTELNSSDLRSLVDDPEGLGPVTRMTSGAGFEPKPAMDRLVFTDPDRAVADVQLPAVEYVPSPFGNALMEFRRIDGTWKVAKRSFCAAVGPRANGCPSATR